MEVYEMSFWGAYPKQIDESKKYQKPTRFPKGMENKTNIILKTIKNRKQTM